MYKNLHIGQMMVKPSFGPIFIDATHFSVVLDEQDLYNLVSIKKE